MEAKGDLSLQHLKLLKLDQLTVQTTGTKRKVWRLGPTNEFGGADQEVVIRMQGILAQADLTPGNVSRFTTTTAINMSQRVQLIGLESPTFKDCIDQTRNVAALYAQHFKGFKMSRYETGDDVHGDFLNASNRFFTSLHDDPQAVPTPFGAGVDIMGVLPKLQGTVLVHTEDNAVKYFRIGEDPKTKEAVRDAAFPALFQVGDIVEVHGSFIAFTTKKGKEITMLFNLQTITLIDSSFTKAATMAKNKSNHAIDATASFSMRRKAPYENEDGEIHKRFRGLAVTEAMIEPANSIVDK
ncbi:hypothetical protein C8J57DRAFT_1527028 [Mycena rebaudengoi]|nr:hypothetical protein C8J57DRAFT_1527028 [Mycena rebaudengoi]